LLINFAASDLIRSVQGFSNDMCLLILTCLALLLGMQCKDADQTFICGVLVFISLCFPLMGDGVT
jgi:hypothetical protein